MPKLDLEAIKARWDARNVRQRNGELEQTKEDIDIYYLIARVEELEAAIRAKCAYCRESWDAGLDDPAFCPTNCPLLPYRGGE